MSSRFENPDEFALFIPEEGAESVVGSPASPGSLKQSSAFVQLADDANKLIVKVKSGGVLVQKAGAAEKQQKARGKKQVLYEEDGVMGMYLDRDAEMRQYPDLENLTVEMRRMPRFLCLMFQNGNWRANVRYAPDMKLSALLATALHVGREINRVSEGEEVAHWFAVDPSSAISQSSAQESEESGWPHTLFFDKKNMWLEETEADLKSRGIEVRARLLLLVLLLYRWFGWLTGWLAGWFGNVFFSILCSESVPFLTTRAPVQPDDVLELRVKPKLVRVYIKDDKSNTSTSKMIKYMPDTTVHRVIEQIREMRSGNVEEGGEGEAVDGDDCDYGLFLSHNRKAYDEGGEGVWLGEDKRLASYHLELTDSLHFLPLPEELRRKQHGGAQLGKSERALLFIHVSGIKRVSLSYCLSSARILSNPFPLVLISVLFPSRRLRRARPGAVGDGRVHERQGEGVCRL